MRHDVTLSGRLYISNQHRDGDPDEFFSHENQPHPPSLADFGELRTSGTKSDLLKKLEDALENAQPKENREGRIFDGGALIHMLTPKCVHTFAEFATMVFLPFLRRELEKTGRIDVLWDRYLPDSIKNSTRIKKGSGIRVKVCAKAKIPLKWNDFLRDPKNKETLLDFLSEAVDKAEWPESSEVYISKNTSVTSKGGGKPMTVCAHEEVDTRVWKMVER